MERNATVISTSIPANEALSGVVDLGGHELVAIECSEDTTATTMTFQAKARPQDETGDVKDEDWDNVYTDDGTEVSITVASNRVVSLTGTIKDAIAPLRYIRLRSGTSAAPAAINPGAEFRFIVK